MKIKEALKKLIAQSLSGAMDVTLMTNLAQELLGNYDLHKRTGFPENIPVPRKDASRQVVDDVCRAKLLPHFVNMLIGIHYDGHIGRKMKIANLREMVKGLHDYGFIYDQENSIFIEDSSVRRTRNWGILREGEECIFSFLRLDIVGNSKLVRKYDMEIIQATYSDLRRIVQASIDKREGRVWNWEGDGGIVAFFFSDKNTLATLSGMEIINELFIYNQLFCRLDEDLKVRIAIHTGPCDYLNSVEELLKSETIKTAVQIEAKYTKPNTVTISNVVFDNMDPTLGSQLQQIEKDRTGVKYYCYGLEWE